MDIWVASTFWRSWIALLLNMIILLESPLSVFLGRDPEVETLDHMLVLFLIFWGTAFCFSTVAAPFYILTDSAGMFSCFVLFVFRFICFDGEKGQRGSWGLWPVNLAQSHESKFGLTPPPLASSPVPESQADTGGSKWFTWLTCEEVPEWFPGTLAREVCVSEFI